MAVERPCTCHSTSNCRPAEYVCRVRHDAKNAKCVKREKKKTNNDRSVIDIHERHMLFVYYTSFSYVVKMLLLIKRCFILDDDARMISTTKRKSS